MHWNPFRRTVKVPVTVTVSDGKHHVQRVVHYKLRKARHVPQHR